MADLKQSNITVDSDDPLGRRTGGTIGESFQGAEGFLAGDAYRIVMNVLVPLDYSVPVQFPSRPE